jgi:hypothetical protein
LSNQTSGREFPKVFRAHNRADSHLGVRSLFGHTAKFKGCQGFSGLNHRRGSRRGSFSERGKGEVMQVMQEVRGPLPINPCINRKVEAFEKKRIVEGELEEIRALARQATGGPGRHALENLDQHRSRDDNPRKA